MKIIFHHPGNIGGKPSASALRPKMMYSAFQENGYEVSLITGGIHDRRKSIQSISRRMKEGEQFDFVYVENSSSPMIYSAIRIFGKIVPIPVFSDFLFFLRCKAKKIPVGYFFRDIYWNFPETFGKNVSKKKRIVLKLFGHIELWFIKHFVTTVFVPNESFGEYLKDNYNINCTPLPPGCVIRDADEMKKKETKKENQINDTPLKLFYVGGCGPVYNPRMFFEAMKDCKDFAELVYCTRENEWLHYCSDIEVPSNVKVIFESGERVAQEIHKADVCVHTLPPSPYSQLAFPYKIAEYIGYGKPLLVFEGTHIANIVTENKIGFVSSYSKIDLKNTIQRLIDKDLLWSVDKNVKSHRLFQTWKNRIDSVKQHLTQLRTF